MNKIFNILSIILLVTLVNSAFAITRTVNKEGGSQHTSIISAFGSVASGDTILIQCSDIDTFFENFNNQWRQPVITIRSNKTNPDSFPVLTCSNWDQFWAGNGLTRFENVILQNCDSITLGNSTNRVSIKNSVLRDFKGNVFVINGNNSNLLTVNNVIFSNNGSSVIWIRQRNASGPYGNMSNCTFFGNSAIMWAGDNVTQYESNTNRLVTINNSIFDTHGYYAHNLYLSKFTYCLAPAISGWGTGCISGNPRFINAGPALPSDFRLLKNSLARNAGSTNANAFDIAGNSREGIRDIGAWESKTPTGITLSSRSINENTPSGTLIGTLSTIDANPDDACKYEIVGDSSSFRITGQALYSKKIFNYEADSTYTLKIRTTDIEGLSFDSTFNITITDVNDPVTGINLSNNTIAENYPSGRFIGKLSSLDGDLYDIHTYSLRGGDSSYFTIRNDSLLSKAVFNYESDSLYNVTVRSNDNKSSVLDSSFLIRITNVNEQPTSISLSKYSVSENVPPGTVIGNFSTEDPDLVNSFTYILTGYNNDNAYFSISGNSLRTDSLLNYESDSVYTIRVRSSDGSFNVDSTIVIKVTNVNDTPDSLLLSKNTIFDTLPAGTLVGILSARDQDAGEIFKYSLDGSGDSTFFRIRGDSLQTATILSYRNKSLYSIKIRVTDKGNATLERDFSVTILSEPHIITEPMNVFGSEGKSVSFKITAIGTGVLSYNWYQLTNTAVTLSDSSVLVLNDLSLEESKSMYYCEVSNYLGNTDSRICTLTVLRNPLITRNLPDTITITETSTCTLSVSASGDSISYLWIRNQNDTLSETSSQLIISDVKESDTGKYRCIVYNLAAKIESNILFMRVLIPPKFSNIPDTVFAVDGDTAKINLTVNGTNPITYKWIKNGTDSVGSSAQLVIPNISITENGSFYYCKASNVVKSDSTGRIYLKINSAPPVIDSQPVTVTVIENQNAIFKIKAHGTAPLLYSWKSLNSSAILSDSNTLIINNVKNDQNKSGYFCIVSNAAGDITSDTVSLVVIPEKPLIVTQPLSQKTNEKRIASFFIVATGTDTLRYSWHKIGIETVLSTKDTLVIDPVSKEDSGFYYCIINNNAGSDTSDTVSLVVDDEQRVPQITLQPQSQEKFIGNDATFTIDADGYPAPRFKWIRNNKYLENDTTNSLIIYGLTFNNNNDSIMCMVYNTVDTIFSQFAVITITPAPKADFSLLPSRGKVDLNVTFTNTSTGTFSSSLWDFGDGIKSTESSPLHIYTKGGLYSVKLIVSGVAGNDTVLKKDLIYVYNEGENPVQISAKYLHNSNVIITLKGLDEIEPQVFPPLYDSLGIWISKESLPVDAKSSIRLKKYPRDKLMNKESFTDTLTFPEAGITWFITNGLYLTSNKLSVFNPGNGTQVLLKDTVSPINVLTINGKHLGGDSSLISIRRSSAIDTLKADSVVFCYATDSLGLNYSGSSSYRFSTKEFNTSVIVEKKIFDGIFAIGVNQIWCGVRIKGKNGKLSSPQTTKFITENTSVSNTVRLSAQAVNSSTIRLSWENKDAEGISKIRIWYGTKEIPLGTISSRSDFNSIEVIPPESSYTFTLLNDLTMYYFGAQINKDGVWSTITIDSRTSAKTMAPSEAPAVVNQITFHTPFFDSINAKIKLTWCIDTIGIGDSLELGISYSNDGFETNRPVDMQILRVENICDSTILKLPNITFNNTYYISMWLRKEGGQWATPVEASMKSITTPDFKREPVILFEPSVIFDTVQAFNGTVILSKDSHYGIQDTVSNAIIFHKGKTFNGMIWIGNGFRFDKTFPNPGFWIALKYTVPNGFKATDIGMYRETPNGLLVEYGFINDTINKIISVRTQKIDYPFILLIDTIAPKMVFSKNPDTIVQAGSLVADTVTISDNILNAGYQYCYSTGKDSVSLRSTDTLSSNNKQIVLIIPKEFISVETGTRAELRIFDGIHKVSSNMSRQVHIDKLEMRILPLQWTPVSVSAELFTQNSDSLIVHISETDSASYDNRFARLFYWYPTQSNINSDDHWIEYNEPNKSYFNFLPGKTFWVKARNEKTINFGSALTMSLKDTAEIVLPAKDFTDLTLPYNFAIRIKDIISASGTDSIGIYKWVNDSSLYITKSIYIPGRANKQNKNDSLDWRFRNAYYTIYNLSNKQVILRIPPVPVSMSAPMSLNKKNQKQTWGVTLESNTGKHRLSEVYCGYSEGIRKLSYPVSPGFGKTKVKLYERNENKYYGGNITGSLSKGGLAQEVVFENMESTPIEFNYDLSGDGVLPSNIMYAVLDPQSQEWKQSGTIDVAANSVEYRWLAVADHSFMERFKNNTLSWRYSLARVYAIRNAAILKFTIPSGAKERLKFYIFDAMGRLIWEKSIHHSLSSGEHTLIWKGQNATGGKVGTGMYFVKFSVIDSNGKISKVFNSRLMYVQ